MLHDLRQDAYSSRALVAACLAQIEHHNPTLNALATLNENALRDAEAADHARARGERGALLGLPVLVKDSIDVAGLPTTVGLPERADRIAPRDAPTVARLRAAGAILLGKSNLPPYAGDWQTNNRLFGRSNNPWDPARTPGGSTGGGAAAIAAGFAALELGSDLAGSLRLPAVFTGVYGHRPSAWLLPVQGNFGGDESGMTVLGPLARSAADLTLALNVLSGGKEQALPAPRHARLGDFRLAWVEPPDWLPVEHKLLEALHRLLAEVAAEGAQVQRLPEAVWGDLRQMMMLYQRLVAAITARHMRAEQRTHAARANRARGGWRYEAAAEGYEATPDELAGWQLQRLVYRARLQAHFASSDLIVAPVTLGAAYPHIDGPMMARSLQVNGRTVPYDLQMGWPALAALPGLPATAVPIGRNAAGLPLGVQLIGPYREDRTPLAFARLLAEAFGGYTPPPGY